MAGLSNSFSYDNPQDLLNALGSSRPRPSSFPSAAEVRRDASECSREIFGSYNTLNQILIRHEQTLRKRWTKRTKDARKKLLLSVRPNIPHRHRPDFWALERESPTQLQSDSKFVDAFMWPYLNLEDLTQSRPLLLLLNSRGRNLPDTFAHADFDAINTGYISGVIRPAFLNGYTMLLHGQTTSETYGKLLSWDDHEEAFDWLTSGLHFHPGMGLLVLQSQQGLLEFLVQCCQVIFQDRSFNSLTDESILPQPEPPTLLPNESAYPSLAAMVADTPYRVPAHLDFRHLRSLAAARSSAAKDHILALREDPGYFSSVVGDYSEHRQETLLDTNGKRHPVLKEFLFWHRAASTAIADAYSSQFMFEVIDRKIVNLERLQRKYSERIFPLKKLPQEYQQALLNLDYLLEQTSKGLIQSLKVGVPPSPPLRSLFVREPQEPNTTMILVRAKQNATIKKDKLIRLFRILWDDQQLFLLKLPNVMDELERVVETEREQKQRLSGWVASFVSDLALLAQMKNQLNLYQPWASTFEKDAVTHSEAIKADFSGSISSLSEYMEAAKSLPSIGRLVTPLRDKFIYPIDKPRTKQTTDALRAAENNLDLFWKVIDQHFHANCHSDTLKQLFSGNLDVQRTPEWVEPVPSAKSPKPQAEEDLTNQFSHLSTDASQLAFEPARPKNKVKTRGLTPTPESPAALEPTENIIPSLPPDHDQPQFLLPRRAYKVFSTLFHIPNQTDTPGDVPWQDFLHAMAFTGFQFEKLYGSVWQFTPSKLDVESSIQFHEPHPSGKIPFRMARRFGRRLGRMYGWEGRVFGLK